MGRKAKYSKEVKIKACKDYEKGHISFQGISDEIGTTNEVVRQWYLRYKEHGPNALDTSSRNQSYSKEFKLSVVEEYTSGKYSMPDLAAKYNIAYSVVRRWINKWYNGIDIKDYDPKGDVYTMKSRKTTFEERLEIVQWVIDNNMSYKDAADMFSITYALVYKWTRAYIDKGPEALKYQKRGPKPKSEIDESNLTEIEKLKHELEKEKALCEVLDVSRSGYYKHKNRIKPEKEKQDELLCSLINEYHSTFDGILGYRRMTMFINKLNHKSFSEGYIHRLMNVLGITARIRRKKVNRIRVKPEYTKENILSRDFSAKAPNKKWLTDVTELSIPGDSRKLYLSPIMDLYDNSIIEYELSFKNNNHLVFSMLDKAIQKYPDAKPIFHSDRGFQYTGNIFKSKVEEAGMTQSMSRVGKCIDNGPMEGFFGTLKAEMFYGKKFRTLEELRGKIVEYIIFYNEKRFQKRLRCMAPLEYRNHASKCA